MRLDRLNSIENYVIQHGTVSLDELTEYFDVSTNTIRRDLSELTERGRIKKVYGGVSANDDPTPISMPTRSSKNVYEKALIGELAAQFVEDSTTVFVDSGSTALTIVPYLATHHDITVVTHSLGALYEASKYPNLKIVALGGLYNFATSSFTDSQAMEMLSRISLNTVFIAATGVSLTRGLTNTTFSEAEIKRSATQNGKQIILMADHSKFDNTSIISFCNFDSLYAVVTDKLPDKPYVDFAAKNGIKLVCAEHPKAK